MENHHIPEEVIWEEYEASKLMQQTLERVLTETQWKREYIDFLTQESCVTLPETTIHSF